MQVSKEFRSRMVGLGQCYGGIPRDIADLVAWRPFANNPWNLVEAAENGNDFERAALATNPGIANSHKALKMLAADRSETVRIALARNQMIDGEPEILWVLANDRSYAVRVAVAEHRGMRFYAAITMALEADPNPYVRGGLIGNLKRYGIAA